MKKFNSMFAEDEIDEHNLVDCEMSKAGLHKQAKIALNTMKKLKNEYVAMPILDKICKISGIDYGEIMEYIPDNENDSTDE